MDELSEEQRLTVNRARKIQQFLSQSFHVAEKFTGNPGVYVRVEDTVRSFAEIATARPMTCPSRLSAMLPRLRTCASAPARWGRSRLCVSASCAP